MKYTIEGFSQKKLIEFGMDAQDALILRYFIDFVKSNKMISEVVDGKTYYWIRYDNVISNLPILNMKKGAVQRRFYKMRNAGLLIHYIKKSGGTFSYFGIGDRYHELVEYMKEKLNLNNECVKVNCDAENYCDNEIDRTKMEQLQDISCSEVKMSHMGDTEPAESEKNIGIEVVDICNSEVEIDRKGRGIFVKTTGKYGSKIGAHVCELAYDTKKRDSYIIEEEEVSLDLMNFKQYLIDITPYPIDLYGQGYGLKVTTNNPSTKEPLLLYNMSFITTDG